MKKLLFFVACLFVFSAANATEEITNFNVTMQVAKDGSAQVTEEISIIAEHNQINRGIYRDLPQKIGQRITPLSLTMDGQTHPFFTEKKGRVLRVNFGNDNYIEKGPHTYRFTYDVQRAVGSFSEYDEIYWNVTGNYWVFHIEKASFTLILPQGAQPIEDKISLYTGSLGAKENNAAATGTLTFETTLPLMRGEGFTVAVPWQKGIVKMPPLPFWQNPRNIVISVILVILAYMFVTWHAVGRDPKDRVVRQYDPPKNISPAAARYLTKMIFDDKCFAVALMSMALKGAVQIKQKTYGDNIADKDSFLGKIIGAVKGPYVVEAEEFKDTLSPEEKAIYLSFFGNIAKQVTFNSSSRKEILAAMKAAKDSLSENIGDSYFKRNLAFTMPVLVVYLLLFYYAGTILPALTPLIGIFTMIMVVITVVSSRSGKTILSLIPFLIFLAIVGIEGVHLLFVTQNIVIEPAMLWYGGGLCFIFVALTIYDALIRAYTKEGRAIMDEVEGFKQYLSIAEEHRARISDPTDAQKIFCDYFAYAVALDVENEWVKSFESTIGAATMEQGLHSHGIMASSFSTAAGISSFSSSFSSSVSSSSGSGGGGSSGGGGGGGGGGGR